MTSVNNDMHLKYLLMLQINLKVSYITNFII